MNADRLLKLADFLSEKVERDSFNMSRAADPGFKEGKAAACAFGWATVAFPRQLKATKTGSIKYGRATDMDAAEKFFGLEEPDAHELFTPDGTNQTPKQVANKLRRFVAKAQQTKKKTSAKRATARAR